MKPTPPLFNVLDTFGLLEPRRRIDRLAALTLEEVVQLTDQLSAVLVEREAALQLPAKPLDLWLPFPSVQSLDDLPAYLFLFDRAFFPDLLLDYLSDYSVSLGDELSADVLSAIESFDAREVLLRMIGDREGVVQDELPEGPFSAEISKELEALKLMDRMRLNQRLRLAHAEKINRTINYYVEYADLIGESLLVPFNDATSDYSSFISFLPQLWQGIFKLNPILNRLLDVALPEGMDESATASFAMNWYLEFMEYLLVDFSDVHHFLPTMIAFKTVFPAAQAGNLHFGNEKNKQYVDAAIAYLAQQSSEVLEIFKPVRWPGPADELVLKVLRGIPAQELLEVRRKEYDAVERYKYSTQHKLERMRQSLGNTQEYSGLVRSFALEQELHSAEIEQLANAIRKDFRRKIAGSISTMTLSGAGAILSAMATVQDPGLLFGVGIGGAGLAAGLARLIENWVHYRADSDKLQQRDGYILWRLRR